MKGQIDLMVAMAYSFGVIILIALMTYVLQSQIFNSATVQQDFNQSPPSIAVFHHTSEFFTSLMTIIAFIYLFIALGAIFAATQTESNILFAAIAILFLPIELIFSLGFHDAFITLMQSSVFSSIISQYPFILLTFTWLPMITLVTSFVIIIFTFARG